MGVGVRRGRFNSVNHSRNFMFYSLYHSSHSLPSLLLYSLGLNLGPATNIILVLQAGRFMDVKLGGFQFKKNKTYHAFSIRIPPNSSAIPFSHRVRRCGTSPTTVPNTSSYVFSLQFYNVTVIISSLCPTLS